MTANQSATAKAGVSANNGAPEAARIAQSAINHLCQAEAYQRVPLLREEARAERITAAVQLRQALDLLEQAA